MFFNMPPPAPPPLPLKDCPICNGTGQILLFQFYHPCYKCNGSGKVDDVEEPQTD
jgi:DnaJ-class molecular chaperone